jgi:Flp pilus assembly protein TadG
MHSLRFISRLLKALREDERGTVPVEGLLAFTFLAWWYMASFTFFDAFRQKNINLKAAYTIADMLSRETGPIAGDSTSVQINQTYVNGLNTMFDYLTNSRQPTWIRVTSVYWDDNDDKYRVDWSATSGTGHDEMTTYMLQAYKDRIPVMPNGDTVVLVETFMAYTPVFKVGLDPRWFQTFITTAPRFASCVPWQTDGCGTDKNGNWVNPDMTDIPPPDP